MQNGIVIFTAEKIVGKAVGKACVEQATHWPQLPIRAGKKLEKDSEKRNLNTPSILVVKVNSILYPNLDAFIAPGSQRQIVSLLLFNAFNFYA